MILAMKSKAPEPIDAGQKQNDSFLRSANFIRYVISSDPSSAHMHRAI